MNVGSKVVIKSIDAIAGEKCSISTILEDRLLQTSYFYIYLETM